MDTTVLTVSEYIDLTNQTLDYAYPMVVLEGEVSQFKVSRDKYVFFDLKDEGASVGCFMMVFSLRVALEDGMKIRITAKPKLTQWGKFSLTVHNLELVGDGALQRAFELMKAKLTKEGLFSDERKRPLPSLPRRIGVISSTGAAGYKDFITLAGKRWGDMHIDVADVRVQGERSPQQVAAAFDYFNQAEQPYDALVLIRGGGSLDDLQAFNDELVVRAVAGSRYPVIVGVGHEQDVTLADLAADVRASTPSNAAEILTPNRYDFSRDIDLRLRSAVSTLKGSLRYLRESIDAQLGSMRDLTIDTVIRRREDLAGVMARIDLANPAQLISRGYAVASSSAGVVVRSVSDVRTGEKVMIQLSDGTLVTEVVDE